MRTESETDNKCNCKWIKNTGFCFLTGISVGQLLWCKRNKALLNMLLLGNDHLQDGMMHFYFFLIF